MYLTTVDWVIIGAVFLITMMTGFSVTKGAGKSKADYFVGGRSMPWWLLGFSMVATTFSSDTPNLVADMVRSYGICGNWQWWAMLPSSMLTVFLYSKLWRRSGTVTDVEFYELRYSGKTAAFLRGFRAVYLGFFFSVLAVAGATLAAIKIGAATLGLTPIQSVLAAMIITSLFSAASGLRGVLLSDFFLFIVAMSGAIISAYFVVTLPEIGGLSGMLEKLSAQGMTEKTQVFGFSSAADWIALFMIPITIIWWSVWYPGAEPGGGGFLVQRMLAAKDEKNAASATLFFNVLHYALRPWPWMIVALCSIILYPDRAALLQALGGTLPEAQVQNDVAYSLMIRHLPHGWSGLVVASLFAAYVSTISTLLNCGSSYLVNDFYGRFVRPHASEKEQVLVGRCFTILLTVLGGFFALTLSSALNLFIVVLSIGAGTGLLFMIRWFWWRINAAAEITAMIASFVFSVYFMQFHDRIFPAWTLSASEKMVGCIFLTTIAWLIACYVGPQTEKQRLYDFCKKINPSGTGWNAIRREAEKDGVDLSNPAHPQESLWYGIIASVFGCVAVYGVLYGTGELLYSHWISGSISFAVSVPAVIMMWHFGVTARR